MSAEPLPVERGAVRLLLVEDDPSDAELVRFHADSFTEATDVVAVAASLAEALGVLEAHEDEVDVLIADLGLPDADGLEVVEALVGKAPDLPVIVLTGRDVDGNPALEAGAQDYLVKQSLQAADLERAVRYAMSRQATINALRSTTRDVEHLVYSVTHDLKGPLTVASGFLDMLRDELGPVSVEADEMLEAIERSHKRMGGIVADLLQYARAVHGPLQLGRTDLNVLLAEVVGSRTPPERAAFEVGELPTIVADQRLLRHVFENLVGNALKYASPDRPLEVRVTADRHPVGWRIDVADNGLGIPAEMHERVFDIFVRSPEVEKIGGTGIGLSICRRAVERHGGRIWVSSRAGEEGTTFSMLLPASAQAFAPGAQG